MCLFDLFSLSQRSTFPHPFSTPPPHRGIPDQLIDTHTHRMYQQTSSPTSHPPFSALGLFLYRIPSIRPFGAVTWNTHSFVLSRPSIEARGSPWPPCHTHTPPAGAGTDPTRSASLVHEMGVLSTSQDRLHRLLNPCLLYTSPSPRDLSTSRMPSSA